MWFAKKAHSVLQWMQFSVLFWVLKMEIGIKEVLETWVSHGRPDHDTTFQENFDPDTQKHFLSTKCNSFSFINTNKQTKTQWRTYIAFWWVIFCRVFEYLQLFCLPQGFGHSLAAREVERNVKKENIFPSVWIWEV